MERAQIFVIAAVIAALGLLGARLWLERGTTDVDQWVRETRSGSAPAADRERGSIEAEAAKGKEPKARGTDAQAGGGPARSDDIAAAGAARAHGGTSLESGKRSDVIGAPPRPNADAAEPNQVADKPVEAEDGLLLSVANAQDIDRANVSNEVEVDENGLKFTDDSQLVYDNGSVHGDAGTIAFSLEPQWDGKEASDNSFVQVRNEDEWSNRLQIVKNGSYLRFILADDTGQEADISYKIDDWQPGQQHRIAVTWGDARTALYVDGRLVGQNTYAGQFRAEDAPLYVGSDYQGGDYVGAGATIRDFKVYGKVLPYSRLAGRR